MQIKKGKNLVMQGVTGSLGGQIVARQGRNGAVILSAPPQRTAGFTPAQEEAQAKMALAVAYGKNNKNNAVYLSVDHPDGGKYLSPYHAAVADYRTFPQGAAGILFVDQVQYDGTNPPTGGLANFDIFFEFDAITVSAVTAYTFSSSTGAVVKTQTLSKLTRYDEPGLEQFRLDLTAAYSGTGELTDLIAQGQVYIALSVSNLPGNTSYLSGQTQAAADAKATTQGFVLGDLPGLKLTW